MNEKTFATKFAGVQYHLDVAKNQETYRMYGIDNARYDLQEAFEQLPQAIQILIMEVHAQLKVTPPQPPVRKVNFGD